MFTESGARLCRSLRPDCDELVDDHRRVFTLDDDVAYPPVLLQTLDLPPISAENLMIHNALLAPS